MTNTESNEIVLTTRQECYDALIRLVPQARYTIDIFSHDFDGNLYNTAEITSLFKNFALLNRQARLRVLLKDPQALVKRGHQIIELQRRLTSKIFIHQASKDAEEHYQSLVLIDKTGIIYRPYSDRFEGSASFNNPLRVKQEAVFFEKVWESSSPSQEMQRLHI